MATAPMIWTLTHFPSKALSASLDSSGDLPPNQNNIHTHAHPPMLHLLIALATYMHIYILYNGNKPYLPYPNNAAQHWQCIPTACSSNCKRRKCKLLDSFHLPNLSATCKPKPSIEHDSSWPTLTTYHQTSPSSVPLLSCFFFFLLRLPLLLLAILFLFFLLLASDLSAAWVAFQHPI